MAELEQQADPLALQTLGCQGTPKPFSCHQGFGLSAASMNQALLMAAGTRASGIRQWQRLAPGKGLGAAGDMATSMGLDSWVGWSQHELTLLAAFFLIKEKEWVQTAFLGVGELGQKTNKAGEEQHPSPRAHYQF